MRQTKIVIDLIQSHLLGQAGRGAGEGIDPSTQAGHVLADTQIQPFNEGRVDLPAVGSQMLADEVAGTKHNPPGDRDQTTASPFLDDLDILQFR